MDGVLISFLKKIISEDTFDTLQFNHCLEHGLVFIQKNISKQQDIQFYLPKKKSLPSE